MKVHAVLPAAGVGLRFGANTPKQYQLLAGKTILERSISRLLACKEISSIHVAINEQDNHWQALSADLRSAVKTVSGGAQRSDSVRLAIEAITDAKSNDWILVHDAVRPLVEPGKVTALLDSLSDQEAGAILAMPVYETVKQANAKGLVTATLDRSKLWAAQTPQVFRYDLLKEALTTTAGDSAITDEASAMEACGYAVRLVEGHRSNIKITRQEDLKLAELLIQTSTNL